MAPRKTKAKNAANQEALDRLSERHQTTINSGSDRYGQTLKRAINSLATATEAITTYKQALDLKFVGAHCANIICPPNSDPPSPTLSATSSTASSQPVKKRKATARTLNYEKPKKQALYEKAKLNTNNWKQHDNLTWRVILIIDGRERESSHVIAKCKMSGIPSEERNLPIGDMAWITQGVYNKKVVCELMLGTIIERKTPEDLKSSIFGTRYMEQRLRLVNSGLPQLLYLIEGNIQKALHRCPSETLHSAIWETRLRFGFSILQTPNIEGTVRQLKRMHRRILQRTFPSSFKNTLPVFHEGFSRHEPSDPRRRRPQSLEEMMFEGPPVPPFDSDFISYEELKAKVEYERELANRKVGNVHMKFLKQVSNVSDVKCRAIAQQYPTPISLITGFSESFLADLPTPGLSMRQTTIGPKTAQELSYAYGGYSGAVPKTSTNTTNSQPATSKFVTKPAPKAAPKVASLPSIQEETIRKTFKENYFNSPEEDRKPAAKRYLNTSIGSLLMSTDEETTPAKPQKKAPLTESLLTTDEDATPTKAPPPRSVTIDLLESSSDEDDMPPKSPPKKKDAAPNPRDSIFSTTDDDTPKKAAPARKAQQPSECPDSSSDNDTTPPPPNKKTVDFEDSSSSDDELPFRERLNDRSRSVLQEVIEIDL